MATCGPELSGWAGRIIEGLPEGNTVTTGSIVSYFQYNLYKINAAIGTDFTLSGECIIPELSPIQSGLYEQFLYCDALRKKVLENLGTAAYSFVEAEGHDIGRVRKVAKTTIADSYRIEAKNCEASLKALIDWYNSQNGFGPAVGMVIYTERGASNNPLCEFGDRIPPCYDYLSSCNSVFGAYIIQ